MKRALLIPLLLLSPFIADAQKKVSHVFITSPRSVSDSIKISRLIYNLNTDAAVKKAIYPMSRTSRISCEIFVAHTDGSHSFVHFGGKHNMGSTKDGQIELRSKGAGDVLIRGADDFAELADSVLILDSLKLKIAFSNLSYPSSGYYLVVNNKGQEEKISLPLKNGHINIPGGFLVDAIGKWTTVNLHNEGTPAMVIRKIRIRNLSHHEADALRQFTDNLLRTLPGASATELRKDIRWYLITNNSDVSENQVANWLNTNYSITE